MDHTSEVVNGAAVRWNLMVARGAVGLAFGAGIIAVPEVTLGLLAFLWAAYVVVDGLLAAFVAMGRGRGAQRWGWLLFEGVLGVGAGAVALAWTGVSPLALLVTISVRTALSGLAEVREASLLRQLIPDELLLGTGGVLSIAAGLLMMMVYPYATPATVVWLIGVHAAAFGALELALGLRLHRWSRVQSHPGRIVTA
jgi:uncharacterized membrane protein HdeD (DUF308 family)